VSIDPGDLIILAYLLVSFGVIAAFVLTALGVGWFVDRVRERRRRQRVRRAEEPDRNRTDQASPS
jgi:hypothetical protein